MGGQPLPERKFCGWRIFGLLFALCGAPYNMREVPPAVVGFGGVPGLVWYLLIYGWRLWCESCVSGILSDREGRVLATL